MAKKTEEEIRAITQELLDRLTIIGKTKVESKEEVYHINIETEETGLLIGYHGNTLNSLQLILGTLIFKKLAKWEKIVVNVGDYRQKREEALKSMALQYAQQVVANKEEVTMPALSAFERRIIHLALQDHPEVVSESSGEGPERRITIKLKTG